MGALLDHDTWWFWPEGERRGGREATELNRREDMTGGEGEDYEERYET